MGERRAGAQSGAYRVHRPGAGLAWDGVPTRDVSGRTATRSHDPARCICIVEDGAADKAEVAVGIADA